MSYRFGASGDVSTALCQLAFWDVDGGRPAPRSVTC